MLRSITPAVRSVRAPRAAAVLVVLASAGALAVTGLAAARSFTLRVDKTATVGNVRWPAFAPPARGPDSPPYTS